MQWSRLGETLRAADPLFLVAGSAICLLFPLLNAARWLAVLRGLGVPLGYGRCLRITMGIWPVGTLTPAKAGEFLKAAAIRDLASAETALGSTLSERVVDVGVLGLLALGGGLAAGQPVAIAVGAVALGAALLSVPVLRFAVARLAASPRPLAAKLRALAETLPAFAGNLPALAGCVSASALNWFLSILQLQLLLRAFGAASGLSSLTAAVPTATFAGLLPFTIAGAGTRDAALQAMLDVPMAPLLAASVAYTLTGYFGLGILGLPFLGELRSRPADPSR